jgi:hypothetical protein
MTLVDLLEAFDPPSPSRLLGHELQKYDIVGLN